ncbi:Transporter [uncultured Candidatus Thioglobus sp.]|nr:Transporter [uncultured Candidatus Thioglobus sp.]
MDKYFSIETQQKLLDTGEAFVTLLVELTFLFIAISYFVALINQKISPEKIQKLLGARNGKGFLISAGLGAITPFCSCSTIPMLIGLLKARAGFGPVMTFLFTSPLLNPIVIILFIPVLGVQVTIIYAVLALSISIAAGVLLQYFKFDRFIKQELIGITTCDAPSDESTSCCSSNEEPASSCCSTKKVQQPSLYQLAWVESWSLFKVMMPYMFISMIIGAVVHGFVPTDFFTEVAGKDNPAAIPVAALVGIPLYIRVTALIPLIGSFIAKGVSIGAVMALVIGSGGASLPEMILLKKIFKWPLLLAFLSVIFIMAIVGGFVFNALIS